MIGRAERVEALEEIVRRLQEIKADPAHTGELGFEDAQVEANLTTALSAIRAALSATRKSSARDL